MAVLIKIAAGRRDGRRLQPRHRMRRGPLGARAGLALVPKPVLW